MVGPSLAPFLSSFSAQSEVINELPQAEDNILTYFKDGEVTWKFNEDGFAVEVDIDKLGNPKR